MAKVSNNDFATNRKNLRSNLIHNLSRIKIVKIAKIYDHNIDPGINLLLPSDITCRNETRNEWCRQRQNKIFAQNLCHPTKLCVVRQKLRLYNFMSDVFRVNTPETFTVKRAARNFRYFCYFAKKNRKVKKRRKRKNSPNPDPILRLRFTTPTL
jgi:hypothetical protein